MMITSPNQIYSNPEAYALEVLKQKLTAEAQKAAQQSMIEHTAMKSFLGQGQMIFCIPCGGGPSEPGTTIQSQLQCPAVNCSPCTVSLPRPNVSRSPSPIRATQTQQNFQQIPLQGNNQPAATPAAAAQSNNQPVLQVSFRNVPQKPMPCSPGADDCSLGADTIEIVIDLKNYMPAEVNLNVEDRVIEIRANHADQQGSKTFSRKYELPAAIVVESTKCVLSYDGILYVSAPWHKMESC